MHVAAWYDSIMNLMVLFFEAFDTEFSAFPRDVQTALLAKAKLLECFGPQLGRPHVDEAFTSL